MRLQLFDAALECEGPVAGYALAHADSPISVSLQVLPCSHGCGQQYPDGLVLHRTPTGLCIHLAFENSFRHIQVSGSPPDLEIKLRTNVMVGVNETLLHVFPKAFFWGLGRCCLHGAVLAQGDEAYFFGGPSGAGKSHLAAGLVSFSDFELLADDFLPLPAGAARAYAGPKLVKLGLEQLSFWNRHLPADWTLLSPSQEDGKVQAPWLHDKVHFVSSGAATGPRPLSRIFFLEPRAKQGPPLEISPPLKVADTLQRLLAERHRSPLEDAGEKLRISREVLQLAASTEARSLRLNDNLSSLPTACRQLQEFLAG